jgi:uncharacterized protein YodC (DUF2158 family)
MTDKKVGDLVRLNNGGPQMRIVSGPTKLDGEYVHCSWEAEDEIKLDLFPVSSVTLVQPGAPERHGDG